MQRVNLNQMVDRVNENDDQVLHFVGELPPEFLVDGGFSVLVTVKSPDAAIVEAALAPAPAPTPPTWWQRALGALGAAVPKMIAGSVVLLGLMLAGEIGGRKAGREVHILREDMATAAAALSEKKEKEACTTSGIHFSVQHKVKYTKSSQPLSKSLSVRMDRHP